MAGAGGSIYPETPQGLKQRLALPGVRIKCVQNQRWWPGAPHYQAGINGGVVGPAFNIIGATNTSPIVFTTDRAHGMSAGNSATVRGVEGNTNANTTGTVAASNLTTTTFSLTGVNGNAAYTRGGTVRAPKSNGESADMFNITGSGILTALNLIMGLALQHNDGVLRIYVDGEATPSIQIPIAFLCGKGAGVSLNNAAAYAQSTLKIGNGRFFSDHTEIEFQPYDTWNAAAIEKLKIFFKFPVPFGTSIRATLFQCGSVDNTVANTYVQAEYTTDITSSLRLKMSVNPALDLLNSSPYSQSVEMLNNADLTVATFTGAGWMVGYWTYMESYATDTNAPTFLERDLNIFIDGEAAASYQSSGTEDFFKGAYYFNGYANVQLDGAYVTFWRPGNTGGTTAMITMFRDLMNGGQPGIRFNNGLVFKSQVGNDGTTLIGTHAHSRHLIAYYQG